MVTEYPILQHTSVLNSTGKHAIHSGKGSLPL